MGCTMPHHPSPTPVESPPHGTRVLKNPRTVFLYPLFLLSIILATDFEPLFSIVHAQDPSSNPQYDPGLPPELQGHIFNNQDLAWFNGPRTPIPPPNHTVIAPKARIVKQMQSLGPDQCIPPNPSWSLLEEYKIQCLYEVPDSSKEGAEAWKFDNGAASCSPQGGNQLHCVVRKLEKGVQLAATIVEEVWIATKRQFTPPNFVQGKDGWALFRTKTTKNPRRHPLDKWLFPSAQASETQKSTSRTSSQSNRDHRNQPQENEQPCIMASDQSRQELFNQATQLEDLLNRNLDTTVKTGQQLLQRVIDDFKHLAAFGLSIWEYGRRNSEDPAGAVQRDLRHLNKGILDPNNDLGYFLNDPKQLILDRARVSKYDPWAALMNQVNRYNGRLKVNPGHAAADTLYDGSNFISLKGLFKGIPSCPAIKSSVAVTRTTQEVAAVTKATNITENLTQFVHRAKQFVQGPAVGTKRGWGTSGSGTPGTRFNPECGEYNCFAVALAKARSYATGRRFYAKAIRPLMTSDTGVTKEEIEEVLSTIARRSSVRNPKLYTKQELIDYALGQPSPMTRQRIEEIIRFSPGQAQGLVFVRYRNLKNPEIIDQHIINVHKEQGFAKFVEEQVTDERDAGFYLDRAVEIFFYEYNYPR